LPGRNDDKPLTRLPHEALGRIAQGLPSAFDREEEFT
jgi:hypothetical protein